MFADKKKLEDLATRMRARRQKTGIRKPGIRKPGTRKPGHRTRPGGNTALAPCSVESDAPAGNSARWMLVQLTSAHRQGAAAKKPRSQ